MWKSIRTTNALENLNREFRRRTKTQASFSSEESAVARHRMRYAALKEQGLPIGSGVQRARLATSGISPLARFNYDASTATNV